MLKDRTLCAKHDANTIATFEEENLEYGRRKLMFQRSNAIFFQRNMLDRVVEDKETENNIVKYI